MTVLNRLVPGQIVRSKAGHDKDCIFFVTEIIDENYVFVADGDVRKIESPKKKKVKHLQPYNRISKAIAEKLADGLRIENIELQRELEKSGSIELVMSDL